MMIRNVDFQLIKNRFLSKLKEDVKTIKKSKDFLINTDILSNIYTMKRDTYNESIPENNTKIYKK